MLDHRWRVWIHRGLAAFWVILAVPALLWWADSVLFVILVSLYANLASELAAGEAADDRAILERLDRIEQLLHDRGHLR